MMMSPEFVVFIVTHGRPEGVRTFGTLRRHGYTGPIYLVCDDEDAALPRYQEQFEHVLVFSKAEAAQATDPADNLPRRAGVVYARNAVFGLAQALGVRYFLVFDDDYQYFEHRFDGENVYTTGRGIRDLDAIFAAMLRFYQATPFVTLAMAQGGDYLGGAGGDYATHIRLQRKAMNTFVCSPERPFTFAGRQNEDVTAYVLQGIQGLLFGTINHVSVVQANTQTRQGGMTGLYLELGTYAKSMYTVIHAPASVRVQMMGSDYPRIHHRVDWNATAPKIVPATLRKARAAHGHI